jgi:hypothetical protein
LRELEPPSEDSHAIAALLEKDEETLELLEKTADEMEEGNIADAKLLSFKAARPIRPLNGWHNKMASSSAGSKSRMRRAPEATQGRVLVE